MEFSSYEITGFTELKHEEIIYELRGPNWHMYTKS